MANQQAEPIPDDIQAMSFEAALEALEQIVRKLEAGEVDLEQSIDIYSRGTALKRHCAAKLATAQARIDKIQLAADGTVEAKPFDAD